MRNDCMNSKEASSHDGTGEGEGEAVPRGMAAGGASQLAAATEPSSACARIGGLLSPAADKRIAAACQPAGAPGGTPRAPVATASGRAWAAPR